MLGLGFRINKKRKRKKKGFPIFKKFLRLFYNERNGDNAKIMINKMERGELQLSDRVYICDCGNKIDRDLNASINIKTVGVHAVKQSVMDSTLPPPEVRQGYTS